MQYVHVSTVYSASKFLWHAEKGSFEAYLFRKKRVRFHKMDIQIITETLFGLMHETKHHSQSYVKFQGKLWGATTPPPYVIHVGLIE